jgi:hypothetical protein
VTKTAGRPPIVVYFLLALIASFASLVPGGPIETRDFSHLDDGIYWGFNAFLTTLGLLGVAAAMLIWRGRRAGYGAAIVVAWLFVAVVALDLGRVFPVSPDSTGFLLGAILVLDAILALYVILLSHRDLGHLR